MRLMLKYFSNMKIRLIASGFHFAGKLNKNFLNKTEKKTKNFSQFFY